MDSETQEKTDAGTTQLYVRLPEASMRAFKRLADRSEKTLSQWVLDVLWDEVESDLDGYRSSIEEAEQKALREFTEEKEMVSEIEKSLAVSRTTRKSRNKTVRGKPKIPQTSPR